MYLHCVILLWDSLFSCSSPPRFVLVHSDLPFSSPFVSMFSLSSPFESPALFVPFLSFITLYLSTSFLLFSFHFVCRTDLSSLSTVWLSPAKCPPSTHTSSPYEPSPTSFHPSLSLLRHPSLPPCLPPEIITTSLVKINLYLNS